MNGTRHTSALVSWIDAQVEGHLAGVQRLLLVGVALALVILSGLALVDTVAQVGDEIARHDVNRAIAVGVDTAFLTVILLELLHTVLGREALARQVPDFIVIGITSAIRHGLSLVATASSGGHPVTRVIAGKTYTLAIPGNDPRDTAINLAINSCGVLVLVVALWLVRHSFGRFGEEEPPDAKERPGNEGMRTATP